ncbi:MAG: HEAT repeat domain-containing protein [candidate division Zixibacteria bacterium]|nr:HEAT repeat domain-containing protein [candidate division Zixibacteria bacterium]
MFRIFPDSECKAAHSTCLHRPVRWFLLAAILVSLASGWGVGSRAHADVADARWAADSVAWHWGRDRQVDVIDTRIDVELDPLIVRVAGSVTLTFAPILPRLERLRLDSERLTIDSIKDANGASLTFTVPGHGLEVTFAKPVSPPETTWIQIYYHGEPEMGLYYIPSVKEDPEKMPMIWSQGEEEDNRYWFPGYDYPDDKATAAISVTTPRPNVVVSNGAMVRLDEHPDGSRTFNWVEKVPISNYLIAVAVGAFDSLAEKTIDGLPVTYYCRKGEGEKLKRSAGETPGMIEFFAQKIGVPFPFEKYAQVFVSDFTYGGMENASMTIEAERTLHGAEAHDFYRDRSNGLIAHELAHQWFGDLLTCRDWAHNWLNEGFATYFGDLWDGHRWGHDRFLISVNGTQEGGMGASRGYRRSTVQHQYNDPGRLFDGYAYSRGGAVLHMIHGMLGDSLWWAAIHRYVTDNAVRPVETEDFKRALETVSGRDFDGFFDQWIYHGGHPQLKVQTSFDGETRLLRIDVKQTQKVDAVTPVFDIPLAIECVTAPGREHYTVRIDKLDNTLFIPVSNPPMYILIDPEGWLLADIDYDPATPVLITQSRDPQRVLARMRAVEGLGKHEKSAGSLAALTAALRRDRQPAVRRTAADALAKMGGEEALDSLLLGLDDPDLSTRNSVIYAIGKFDNNQRAFARLEAIARSNAPAPLRGSAVDAASMVDPQRGKSLARWALDQPSEKHTIASDAFTALERSKDPALIDLGLRYATPGHPTPVRGAAVGLIGALAEFETDKTKLDRYRVALEKYLGDRNKNFRQPVMNALGALGVEAAIPALDRVAKQSPQPSEQRAARAAISAIRDKKPDETPNETARKLDEAGEDRKRMEDRIDVLEKRFDALMGPAKTADTTTSGAAPKGSKK